MDETSKTDLGDNVKKQEDYLEVSKEKEYSETDTGYDFLS